MIIETFTRIFIDAGRLEQAIAFYVEVLSGDMTMRFAYPEAGLELAAVSSPKLSVLLIAGAPATRAPFEETGLTIKVDRLEPYIDRLMAGGAEQLEPIQKTPVGRKMRFRHLDGMVVEYVDHHEATLG